MHPHKRNETYLNNTNTPTGSRYLQSLIQLRINPPLPVSVSPLACSPSSKRRFLIETSRSLYVLSASFKYLSQLSLTVKKLLPIVKIPAKLIGFGQRLRNAGSALEKTGCVTKASVAH